MMTVFKTPLIPLLAAALLTGCAMADVQDFAARRASIQLTPRVASNDYQTQAVGAYTLADIDHLVLKLFTVSNGTESAVIHAAVPLQIDVASASLGATITFGNLHHSTTYRVRAYAYKAQGTNETDLISNATSYADITVTQDLRPTMGVIPVRLIGGETASATATSSFIVLPGGTLVPTGPASASW